MNLQRVTARRGMRSNFQSAPLFNKGATCNDTFTDRYAVCLSRWASARIVSDFAGASERTRRLLRQLARHNDVIAAMVFDPLWQRMPEYRALVVSEGRLQVELRIQNERVRAPLASLFKGRTADVAELLRSSGVPSWRYRPTSPPSTRSGNYSAHEPGRPRGAEYERRAHI